MPKYICSHSADLFTLFSVTVKLGGSLWPSRSTYLRGRKRANLFLPASETFVVILMAFLSGFAGGGSKRSQGTLSTLLILEKY